MLGHLGHILILIFVASAAFDTYPVRLLQPDWILAFSTTASNFVAIPLLGVALLHLAGHIAPTTQLKTQRRAARLATLLAILFLLTQPLLAVALHKGGVNLDVDHQRQTKAIRERLETVANAANTASTFGDVQSRMLALQGPPILDESSSVPLPVLKKEILKSINSSQAILLDRLAQSRAQALPQLYKQIARSSILCLIGSLGFSLLAWDPTRNRNIILAYLGSIGIGGLTPVSLAQKLSAATASLRSALRRTAKETIQRRNARKREQEVNRIKNKQKQDIKRREQERRKRLEQFDRERKQRSR